MSQTFCSGEFVVVLAKPLKATFHHPDGHVIKRAFMQPYDSQEEKDRLIECFKNDDLIKEILPSRSVFIKKYGEVSKD